MVFGSRCGVGSIVGGSFVYLVWVFDNCDLVMMVFVVCCLSSVADLNCKVCCCLLGCLWVGGFCDFGWA